ncbi:MAG: fibronectin type III-like domain-contianing protein, partial [Candidatus Acidiferrales bacterium]
HSLIAASDEVTISADVKNAGAVAGDEVVELYLTHPDVPGAPIRALTGFTRIHLNGREQKAVKFVLRGRDLSVVDESGKRQIVPGTVNVWIGGGQPVNVPGLPAPNGLKTEFRITSAATLPD